MKTFDEIRRDLVDRINEIKDPTSRQNFSVDINDPSDVIAIIVNCVASYISELGENLLKFRQSLNPFTATGLELRDVMEYRGLTAKSGTKTTTKVNFKGAKGTVLPEGTKLTNSDKTKIFLTDHTVVINDDGNATVTASCEIVGAIPIANKELTALIEPIFGISSVENNGESIGTNDETDQEIHLRLKSLITPSGDCYIDRIDSALMNLSGVKSAASYVGADSDKGLNAGDFCCVVSGGNDEEIAQILFENNMFLLKTVGNTEVRVQSKYLNREYTVKFQRPEPISDLNMDLVVDIPNESLPNDLIDKLYRASVYFCESLQSNDTFFKSKFISYLVEQEFCDIVSVSTKFSQEEKEKYNIPWNKSLTITKNNFKVTKLNQ